jgi:hypothetical protein
MVLLACDECGEELATTCFEYKHSYVIPHYPILPMSTLQAELQRLYLPRDPDLQTPKEGEYCLITPDGKVRAMVLELARPADWAALSTLWQGVQAELGLPAPAIAVSGIDGFQLWFSLAEPVTVANACAFLESLRLRYLSQVATERITMRPFIDGLMPQRAVHAALVPKLREESGRWSAFVASDLAAIFADEPWLDLPPGPEAQANVLARLECIKPVDFQAVLERLKPVDLGRGEPAQSDASRLIEVEDAPETLNSTSQGKAMGPKRFLLNIMNDPAVGLHLRIEAAKALLPYF